MRIHRYIDSLRLHWVPLLAGFRKNLTEPALASQIQLVTMEFPETAGAKTGPTHGDEACILRVCAMHIHKHIQICIIHVCMYMPVYIYIYVYVYV